jgi:predicted permease
MLRSLLNLGAVNPGFGHPDSVLTLRIMTPGSGWFGGEQDARMHETIVRRFENLPGVVSVGVSTSITMDRYDSNNRMEVEGFPPTEGESLPSRRLKWIGGDYFETMENPLLVGRAFTWSDVHARAPIVVVTEDFAMEHWSNPGEALGKRLRQEGGSWREIVGVVGSVRDNGVDQESVPVVYLPMVVEDFWGREMLVWRSMGYVLRTTRPTPESLVPEIKGVVRSVDARIPIASVQTLDEILAASTAHTSFAVVMLVIAALVALVLSVIGVYGVISYAVSSRSQEIGVRVALGARAGDIYKMVLRQGLGLTAIGVFVGLAGGLASTRLLSSLLFDITPLDGVTYGLAALVLSTVAILACYLPARHASALDPVETLRME